MKQQSTHLSYVRGAPDRDGSADLVANSARASVATTGRTR